VTFVSAKVTKTIRSDVSAFGYPAIPQNLLRSFMRDFLNLLCKFWSLANAGRTLRSRTPSGFMEHFLHSFWSNSLRSNRRAAYPALSAFLGDT
jgi:hypothetical protein